MLLAQKRCRVAQAASGSVILRNLSSRLTKLPQVGRGSRLADAAQYDSSLSFPSITHKCLGDWRAC